MGRNPRRRLRTSKLTSRKRSARTMQDAKRPASLASVAPISMELVLSAAAVQQSLLRRHRPATASSTSCSSYPHSQRSLEASCGSAPATRSRSANSTCSAENFLKDGCRVYGEDHRFADARPPHCWLELHSLS